MSKIKTVLRIGDTSYIFTPEWQFGELGFIFWNWPKFTSDFILEMEAMLNHKITIIYGRL